MKLGKFIAGLGIGAVVGMLFAPKKGSELREELKAKGTDAYNTAKDMTKEDVQDLINKTVDDVKRAIDEFDVEEFKDTTGAKLGTVKTKLEDLGKSVQNSEEYARFKDSVKKVSEDIGNKVEEIKTKIKDKDFAGMDAIDEGIDEIEEELDVIIEDLRD
ncbi:MAG: YtxH domain-containing protein [Coprobacillaceae bacterium]